MAKQAKPNILVIWGDDIGTWRARMGEAGAEPASAEATLLTEIRDLLKQRPA